MLIRYTTLTNMFYLCLGVVLASINWYYFLCYKNRLIMLPVEQVPDNLVNNKPKLIYLDKMPSYYNFMSGDQHFQHCPVKACAVTSLSSDLAKSDAVLFFSHYRDEGIIPVPKQPNQIWIYFAVESPINSYNHALGSPNWSHYFNWTMTYRYDSDIRFGYGKVIKRESELTKQVYNKNTIEKKNKLVAWFVSNCKTQSKREQFVELLGTKIPIDIYGKCGKLKCAQNNDCMKMLEENYKFYLSFENSICKDYISEKAFQILLYDIIPIVRGGANYSKILPRKSFINTADFNTIHDLSRYLQFLDENPAEYLKYFEWKKHYKVLSGEPFPICELCAKLHKSDNYQHVYENVDNWWRKNSCSEPRDLLM